MDKSKREFIKIAGMGSIAAWASSCTFRYLKPIEQIPNPLAHYPDRDWERVYRAQYGYDDSFAWVCSPNCTHACRMRAFTRNGVVLWSEQNFDSHRVKDLLGNQASAEWNPRGCSNGFTFQRRVYGSYRLRHPIIRKGWKRWADDGFPELDAANKAKYFFSARGQDEFEKISWEKVYDYIAKAMVKIATTYSGEEGKKRLLAQGYPEEMLTHWEGAGTRTFKMRGGMGLLGVIGKYGMYRMANLMAVLDVHVRKVNEKDAKGARGWSNYTWHGDQAPGFPFVHGLQASDVDFNELRHTRLHIQLGKNMIENKRADNHFFTETLERGGKIVVITPEYSPATTRADYWIPVRPQSDAALFLGITKILIDEKKYDEAFVRKFTDFPVIVRTDTLQRLRAGDVIPGYAPGLSKDGASFKLHGLTAEQYAKIGDYVVYDEYSKSLKALTRDDVGDEIAKKGLKPALDWSGEVHLTDGKKVQAATLLNLYKIHLKDYDLDSVAEMTGAPATSIRQLAEDIATIKPAAVHLGEGINHWFHATEVNRAAYLPMILTGNIGVPGGGCHTWAGNYKAAIFQGSEWSGPGFKGWVAEDPFHPNLDPNADGKDIHAHAYTYDEEPAYWNYGDRPLAVDTPKQGRKIFTGKTHLPSPTKLLWFTNVNLFNNAKWAYEMLKNVNPNIELIISQDIEMTSTVEYSDIALPAHSWMEFTVHEITASCSNPFLQIWKGGMPPVFDTRDDVVIYAELSKRLGEILNDARFPNYWKFALEKRTDVYIQRLLDASATTRGYQVSDIMAGKYGEPGVALLLFRTYPRIPFWEQIHDSVPFFTPTGRLQAYNDEPEVIEYGENFVVHREGPEATPYLPNVIVSSNPHIRPDDYGIPVDHMGWHERQVRNIKLPWSKVKNTKNPLWEQGFHFYCLTPKTRHATHSSWQVTDWQFIWNNQFGDPYRTDKRAPGVGEHTIHLNPQAARDLGVEDGDYVYVDANPADRPYVGWKKDDPFYKVSRLMLRVKFNPAYPYHIVMMKHGPFIATERSVKAHETRPDGRALSAGTGYQSSFRYGSQQSLTRGWLMPMHQLDSLFHKAKVRMGFLFGFEADNHGVNTTPKETLVKVTKAETGNFAPAKSGRAPAQEDPFMQAYLAGDLIKIA
ncbi:MAG: molybdopterin-dependent oxidoreductase [Nitrospirae bacterium]|nr:molybdopterin-dependent oxidoreductase [Nitrospirota bacterium]